MTRSPELTTVKNELNERIAYHRDLAESARIDCDWQEYTNHLSVVEELEWIKKGLSLDLKLI